MKSMDRVAMVLVLFGIVQLGAAQSKENPFQLSRLLDVDIEMPEADWNRLRHEHHDLFGMKGPRDRSRPRPNPYQYYKGDVTIDGEVFKGVGLRKKGLLGSVNSRRPSLKINFDKFGGEEEFEGISLMTLNNNESDTSQVKQAISYAVFRAAGIPAPRCNFARVSVNGQELGVFTHVESIRKDFLRRHFEKASGSLYEGQGSDFNDRSIGTFEPKTKKNNPSELRAIQEALSVDDQDLFGALGEVIQLDQFFRFWALESLVGHNDGYCGNKNNFYLYRDPTTERFVFLPWGTDGVFRARSGKSSQVGTPLSVLGEGLLANRLYQTDHGRERYRAELLALFGDVWDEKRILGQVDDMVELVKDDLHFPPELFHRAVGSVRRFIANRRDQLNAELTGPIPEFPKRSQSRRRGEGRKRLRMEGQFSVPWSQSLQSVALGEAGEVGLYYGAEAISIRKSLMQAGPNPGGSRYQFPVLMLTCQTESNQAVMLRLLVDPDFFAVSERIPVDGFTVMGSVLMGRSAGGNKARIGWAIGRLRLSQVDPKEGGRIEGQFSVTCNPFSRLRFEAADGKPGESALP